MNCRHIDELIRGGSLGALSPAEQQHLDDHLGTCRRCRDLLRLDLSFETVRPPADLLDAILEVTGGPACSRAEELLSERLDGDLEELDARLVDVHADHCVDCNAMRNTLTRLAADLRALRELEPDADLTREIFDLTSRSADRGATRTSDRLRRTWRQLVQRPRFAWEAAYVGAMLFWLALASPTVALPDTPASADAWFPDLSGARAAIHGLRDPMADLSRRTWISTVESVAGRSEDLRTELQKRGNDLRTTFDSIDVERSGRAVLAMTEDVRDAVHRLISEDDQEERQE